MDASPQSGSAGWRRWKTWEQHLAPQHLLTRCMHRLTRVRAAWFKNWQIRWFVRRYQVNLSEAAEPNPLRYPDFNSFFTRSLRSEVRPLQLGPRHILCPVDGTVSQAGAIRGQTLLQAKNRCFDLCTLLGGSSEHAALFANGQFATLYLAPRDYHRVHMPVTGTLRQTLYVPGQLFSVSASTTQTVPRLFARNERLIALFDTEWGPLALVLVGAMFVAAIETTWAGPLAAPRGKQVVQRYYGTGRHDTVVLIQGGEMGRFNMGSTVILLFPAGKMDFDAEVEAGRPLRMGQRLGLYRPFRASDAEQSGPK